MWTVDLTVEIKLRCSISPAVWTLRKPSDRQANSNPTLVLKSRGKGVADRTPLWILILIRHVGSRAIFDLTIFLKSQETMEINTKLSQNAYEMYKLATS